MTHDNGDHETNHDSPRAHWWDGVGTSDPDSTGDTRPGGDPDAGSGGGSSCRVRPVWVPTGSLGRALRVLRWEACHLVGESNGSALVHDHVIVADTGPGLLADPTTAVVSPHRSASIHQDGLLNGPPGSESAGPPRALLAAAAGRGHPELAARVREVLGAALTTRRRVGQPALVVLDTAAVTDWSPRLVRTVANLRIRLLITGAEVWLPDPHPALADVIDPATRWSGRAGDTGQR